MEYRQETTGNYYKVDTKTKWTVFACYIGLMAILGYAAYEGYVVLQEHCQRNKEMHRKILSK